MRKKPEHDWQSETHIVRVFKILGNPLKGDFDPIASFFGSAEPEAMDFVKKYVEENPDHHIFADKVANEPYKLLFDSKPAVTEAALKATDEGQPLSEEAVEDEFVPAYVSRPSPTPRIQRQAPEPRIDKKKALQEWLARGRVKKNS